MKFFKIAKFFNVFEIPKKIPNSKLQNVKMSKWPKWPNSKPSIGRSKLAFRMICVPCSPRCPGRDLAYTYWPNTKEHTCCTPESACQKNTEFRTRLRQQPFGDIFLQNCFYRLRHRDDVMSCACLSLFALGIFGIALPSCNTIYFQIQCY